MAEFEPFVIPVSYHVLALRFEASQVTKEEVERAFPAAMRVWVKADQVILYKDESVAERGRLRADSARMREQFPRECERLARVVARPSDYIFIVKRMS